MTITFKYHFSLMAAYNKRLNHQVYVSANKLSEQQLIQDHGAFFGSVFATLNHILVGDLLWLQRFRNHPSQFKALNTVDSYPAFESLEQIAYTEFSELVIARQSLDELIISWIENEVSEADFSESIEYSDTKGNIYRRNFAELLAHFFNHQTHHRGQVSTLLMQLGHNIGITDFLLDIPSQ